VVRNEIDYLSPARFGETLDVFTRISFVRKSSFAFEAMMQEASTGRSVAANVSVHVWLDHRSDRPLLVPDSFRRKVSEFEGENARVEWPVQSV
jgi:acyl-CoA thioesterase FadM